MSNYMWSYEHNVSFWRTAALVLFFTPIIGAVNRGCDSYAEYKSEKKQQEIINSIPEAKRLQEDYLQIKRSLDSKLTLATSVYYYNLNKILEEHKSKNDSIINLQHNQINYLKSKVDSLENITDSIKKSI